MNKIILVKLIKNLGKLLFGLLASIGLLTLGVIFLIISFTSENNSFSDLHEKDLEKIVLHIDLDKKILEGSKVQELNFLGISQNLTIQEIIIGLRRAHNDERVKGLIGTVSNSSLGFAQIQDFRNILTKFQSNNKPTFLFSDTMGELTNSTSTYYLASAFSNIWLQPSGSIGLIGINVGQPFIKNLLEKIGVKAQTLQRYEFKTAAELFTRSEISKPNKEALDLLFNTIINQIVNDISDARNIIPKKIFTLMSNGPLLASEALKEGLVDHIAYKDEFDATIKSEFKGAEILSIKDYLELLKSEQANEQMDKIGIIHAIGPIERTSNNNNILDQRESVTSRKFINSLKEAMKDPDIKAIIVRVDSPGGSYVASDTIWRAIVNAQKNNKPIVISMGNTAASGGYFIAMGAKSIFAQPGTITGSIGVVASKFVIKEALENLGVNWTSLNYGGESDLFSVMREFNTEEKIKLNKILDNIYNDFTNKAATGRKMPIEDMLKIAKGRVWSGEDAYRIGLVDHLGGFSDAIDYTKDLIGIKPEEYVKLVNFPEPKDPLENLLNVIQEGNIPLDIRNSIYYILINSLLNNLSFSDINKFSGVRLVNN